MDFPEGRSMSESFMRNFHEGVKLGGLNMGFYEVS